MRDADNRRPKQVASTDRYACAYPIMHDDSESDADDEYSSEDEFIVLSPDSQSEQGSAISDEYPDSSLRIIDDYFDTMLLSLNRSFHDANLENDEIEEGCPPVIKLNLAKQPGEAMANSVDTATSPDCKLTESDAYSGLEESIGLREGILLPQPEDDDYNADDSDGWSLASYCCSDDWAEEIEAAEEDRIAREQELAVPKTRHNPQSGTLLRSRPALRTTRSNRSQGRKVAFTVRPGIFDE
ncbi:hypothetical protein PG984_002048 [Apiospora sp. TS-2023a]